MGWRVLIPTLWCSTYTYVHKVRTYKEYHSVCPSSELGLSQPLSRQRVFPSPQKQGGGGTLACGWDLGGVPIPTRGIHCGTLYMYVLCAYVLWNWECHLLQKQLTSHPKQANNLSVYDSLCVSWWKLRAGGSREGSLTVDVLFGNPFDSLCSATGNFWAGMYSFCLRITTPAPRLVWSVVTRYHIHHWCICWVWDSCPYAISLQKLLNPKMSTLQKHLQCSNAASSFIRMYSKVVVT